MAVTDVRQMDDEQLKVIERIEKLLRLAGKNTNEKEAAAAAAKAQELLLAYNLDAAAVGGAEADGRRMEEKLKGGFYEHERDLWRYVAELNFCMHWVSSDWIERPEKDRQRKKVQERYSSWAQKYRKVTRHHLVGKKVSVMSTKFTADYLLQAVERLTKDFMLGGHRGSEGTVEGLGAMLRSRRATSFRRGMVETITTRLWEKRQDQLAEERKVQRAAEERAKEAGLSTGTAVTISSVRQSERDANMDFLYGEGWSAKQRSDQAERARLLKEADEAYTKWAAENPEEAAKEAEERRKEEKKASKRCGGGGGQGSRGGQGRQEDWGAFSAGREAGQTVGLDPQAADNRQQRIGRG